MDPNLNKAVPHPTGRLLLRHWSPTDKAVFRALNADPDVMKYFPAVLDAGESDALFERIQSHFDRYGFGLWAVELRENSEFIGMVGLAVPNFSERFMPYVEISWRLSHRYWGQGYATEAARTVLDFGFETLGLKEVVSFTAKINLRSQRLMQRLDMCYCPEEDFDHPKVAIGNVLRPHVLYRLSN